MSVNEVLLADVSSTAVVGRELELDVQQQLLNLVLGVFDDAFWYKIRPVDEEKSIMLIYNDHVLGWFAASTGQIFLVGLAPSNDLRVFLATHVDFIQVCLFSVLQLF